MFTAIKKWLHRMFGKTEEKTVQPVKTKKKLSRADKKQIDAAIVRANRTDKKGKSAQDSIPYERMWPDGICRISDSHYTKTIQFQEDVYKRQGLHRGGRAFVLRQLPDTERSIFPGR